jgi:hypothetical protein
MEMRAHSREYNQNLQLHTLRYAMVGMLQKPPAELAQVVKKHFTLLAPHLRRQGARWVAACTDATLKSRMLAAVDNLNQELDKLAST